MSEGRVALIPGGDRGIGRSVGLALAVQGWDLSIAYLERRESASEVAREVESLGRRVLTHQCDLTQPEEARELVHRTAAHYGRIDSLVHAMGSYHRMPLLDESPEAWADCFAVNLHSFFHLATALAPGMVRMGWGRIIAFGVAGADTPRAWRQVTAHHISKLGLVALTRGLARELAGTGVTVNLISPGFVDSGGLDPDELERGRRLVPSQRIGELEDVLEPTLYLLSNKSSYVTGANILVSGGYGL